MQRYLLGLLLALMSLNTYALNLTFNVVWPSQYIDVSAANQPMVNSRYTWKPRTQITSKGSTTPSAFITCSNGSLPITTLTSVCTVTNVNPGDDIGVIAEVHYADPLLGDLTPKTTPPILHLKVGDNPSAATTSLNISGTITIAP